MLEPSSQSGSLPSRSFQGKAHAMEFVEFRPTHSPWGGGDAALLGRPPTVTDRATFPTLKKNSHPQTRLRTTVTHTTRCSDARVILAQCGTHQQSVTAWRGAQPCLATQCHSSHLPPSLARVSNLCAVSSFLRCHFFFVSARCRSSAAPQKKSPPLPVWSPRWKGVSVRSAFTKASSLPSASSRSYTRICSRHWTQPKKGTE